MRSLNQRDSMESLSALSFGGGVGSPGDPTTLDAITDLGFEADFEAPTPDHDAGDGRTFSRMRVVPDPTAPDRPVGTGNATRRICRDAQGQLTMGGRPSEAALM